MNRARDHREGGGSPDGLHRGAIQEGISGGLYQGDVLDTPIAGNSKLHHRRSFHSPLACQRGVSLGAVDALQYQEAPVRPVSAAQARPGAGSGLDAGSVATSSSPSGTSSKTQKVMRRSTSHRG